jgi:prophage antirepressor-like protein
MTDTPFEFGGKRIRTAGTPDAPLFCAADVCAVLGIANVGDAVSRLRDAERTPIASADARQNTGKTRGLVRQPAVYVTEPGLYKLIFSSRKDEAEKFQDWVTAEVLPEIRRRGVYSLADAMARKHLIQECFRELPEKQATLFNPLIEALKPFARGGANGSGGTPPWARLIASYVYDWTWKEHKGELRKRNPKQDDGTLVWRDYDALTPEGRRLVSITIGMAVFAASQSYSWQDWRTRMEAYFGGQQKLPMEEPERKLLRGRKVA